MKENEKPANFKRKSNKTVILDFSGCKRFSICYFQQYKTIKVHFYYFVNSNRNIFINTGCTVHLNENSLSYDYVGNNRTTMNFYAEMFFFPLQFSVSEIEHLLISG